MKLVLLGATGMVGAGALREAPAAHEVERVLSISRQACGVTPPKLRVVQGRAERFILESADINRIGA